MGKVYELDLNPVSAVAEGLRQSNPHKIKGCTGVTVDSIGVYTVSVCDMSAEQLLAAAEALKSQAIEIMMQREDEQ